MTIFDDIVDNIPNGRNIPSTWIHKHGGIVISKDEGETLAKILSWCGGVHIDIGTYFGGSAILAALVKPSGRVISIDAMVGEHWENGLLTREMVQGNIEHFGVSDKIELIKAFSHPFPVDVIPSTVFIDSDENDSNPRGGVLNDWNNTKDITTDYIIFHDCRDIYPGVVRTVEKAKEDKNWELVESVDSMRVFKHV